MIITHRVVIGDSQRLYRDFYVSTRSCIELSYLARYVEKGRWPGPLRDLISLARLVHTYEGVWLSWRLASTESRLHEYWDLGSAHGPWYVLLSQKG